MSGEAQPDIERGERFAFGRNWQRFSSLLDDSRIRSAEDSVRRLLGTDTLDGLTFADAGSGSGLFSLAARRLGARVVSFDYDADSVACTDAVKAQHSAGDPQWSVRQGSLLDRAFIDSLGKFDVVYCWGVAHHTGQMWSAIENALVLVKENGRLVLAIYNDQGPITAYWLMVKRLYNRLKIARPLIIALHVPYVAARWIARRVRRRPLERGMSLYHDMLDWLGGYPFEVASPRRIIEFAAARGFSVERQTLCGRRHGCNEFVFRRTLGETR